MSEDLAGRELGGCRLDVLLGSGAFGSVWKARQLRLDRDVAVKVLDPVVARDPDTARRFEREGRTAASLDHPNIVPVYEAGESDGLVFLVMRLVTGETLEERLVRDGALSRTEAAELLEPIAAALDHAHRDGLVHRDVKPSNILLDPERIWLADFGIASSVREIGAYTTGVLGTAEYMAPEQANAAEIDHRADLYGLGCVAFRAVVGHPPYPGDDLISVLMSHVSDPIPPSGDDTLDAFFSRALAKDPDARFSSAGELIDALRGATATDEAPPSETGAASVPSEVDAAGGSTAAPNRRRMFVVGAIAVLVAAIGIAAFALGGGDDDDPEAAPTTLTESTGPVPTTAAPDADTSGGAATTGDPSLPVPVAGGTVEVGTTRSLRVMNPHVDRFAEPFVTGAVLPPLMVVNDDWTFSPWLAAEFPTVVSIEPLRVRWELRSDAVWNDGSPITSSDVARTLDYIVDPSSGATGTLLYEGIEIEVVDDTTFEMVFDTPVGGYHALFSTIHPVINAAAYDAHLAAGESPATFLSESIGFSGGPFTLAGFDAEDRLTLVRNDAWWGEAALLDRITIRSYASADAQLAALELGEVDLVYVEDARATQTAQARRLDGVAVDVGHGDQFLRLDFNNARGPLAEAAVRLAVAQALDRALIAESSVTPVTGEAVEPMQSLVWASRQPSNERPFAELGGDPVSAAATLQAAGWELAADGTRVRDGATLSVRLLYAENSSLAEQTLAQRIVVELADIGISVVADVAGPDELFDARRTGSYDMVVALDVVNTDPIAAVFRFGSAYCPESFGVEGCESAVATNLTGVRDTPLDELLVSSSSTIDPDDRASVFVDVDARLAELVVALPLFELPTFVAHTDRLGGVAVDVHRGGPFAGIAGWGFLPTLDVE